MFCRCKSAGRLTLIFPVPHLETLETRGARGTSMPELHVGVACLSSCGRTCPLLATGRTGSREPGTATGSLVQRSLEPRLLLRHPYALDGRNHAWRWLQVEAKGGPPHRLINQARWSLPINIICPRRHLVVAVIVVDRSASTLNWSAQIQYDYAE